MSLCRFGRVRWLFVLMCAFALLAPSVWGEGGDLRLASWNIQHLGHGSNKNYEALARVGGRFDLIAIQEAMTREGLYLMKSALEEATSEAWSVIYSHRIGRGSYQEKYAFMSRDSRVRYLDGAVVFLDAKNRFAREPFSARFQSVDSSLRFVLSTVHILYGRSKADRLPEIAELAEMIVWLEEAFPDDPIVLVGDFNLRPSHDAFRPLRQRLDPLILTGATTLSTINGRYANLYDNIFVSRPFPYEILGSGITRFPEILGWDHMDSRRHVSDHAPVWVALQASGPFPPRGVLSSQRIEPGPSSRQSIDPAAAAPDGPYRGNRSSKILHHPGCPGHTAIAPHNRVEFATIDAAVEQGYRRARNCDWE